MKVSARAAVVPRLDWGRSIPSHSHGYCLEPSTPGGGLHSAAHTWQLVSSALKAPGESETKQARSHSLLAT